MNELTTTTTPYDFLKNCIDIRNRFITKSINWLYFDHICCEKVRIVYPSGFIRNFEYWAQTLLNKTIYIYYNTIYYQCTIGSIEGNYLVLSSADMISGNTSYNTQNEIYQREFMGEEYGPDEDGHYPGNYYGIMSRLLPIGKVTIGSTKFVVEIDYMYIEWWGNADQVKYPDGVRVPAGYVEWITLDIYPQRISFGGSSTDSLNATARYTNDLHGTFDRDFQSNYVVNEEIFFKVYVQCTTAIWGKIWWRLKYSIRITSIKNCRNEEVPNSFICMPWHPNLYGPFKVYLSGSGSSSSTTVSGTDNSIGDCPHSSTGVKFTHHDDTQHTLLMEASGTECWDAQIDYSLSKNCNDLEITYTDTHDPNTTMYLETTYNDPTTTPVILEPGSISVKFNK